MYGWYQYILLIYKLLEKKVNFNYAQLVLGNTYQFYNLIVVFLVSLKNLVFLKFLEPHKSFGLLYIICIVKIKVFFELLWQF